MELIERGLVWLALRFSSLEQINSFFGDAQNTAIVLGSFIALSGGMLGSFLLLRGMSLTSDAISHTVLLGIVVAFMIMIAVGIEPDLSSPWLLMGAATAGVATVVFTELIHRSGRVKQDAALGLVFPFLFAIAVIFVARFVDDVHLDEDAVMIGEIGVAWANTNSHAFGDYEEIVINEDDSRAKFAKRCVNCREQGISPRDKGAVFTEVCINCGIYSPSEAYRAGLTDKKPILVFWPRAITVMFVLFVFTLFFVVLLFKELKLSTFDPGLAKSLGFKPTLLLYSLMALVSLVAVGAFEAVGSILVIAFFIIPAATAYLLTDRLTVMLITSGLIGILSSWTGYELAKGKLFFIDLDAIVPGGWDTSISAAMVVMMLFFFILAFLGSPKYGLVSGILRRRKQRKEFEGQVLLGHIYHHSGSIHERRELAADNLEVHVRWPVMRIEKVLARLKGQGFIGINEKGLLTLKETGKTAVKDFWKKNLAQQAPKKK